MYICKTRVIRMSTAEIVCNSNSISRFSKRFASMEKSIFEKKKPLVGFNNQSSRSTRGRIRFLRDTARAAKTKKKKILSSLEKFNSISMWYSEILVHGI